MGSIGYGVKSKMPIRPKSINPPKVGGDRRNNSGFNYHSTAWRKLRALVLLQEPLCRECKKDGKLTFATVGDHINPLKPGDNGLDIENIQPLCKTCHDSKSAREGNSIRRV